MRRVDSSLCVSANKIHDFLPLNLCSFSPEQTGILSASTELAPYVTQVGQHMLVIKSENVTARYHTFGGVLSTCNCMLSLTWKIR